MKPGLHHDIDAAVYHKDPCPEPSLSSSIAIELLTRSPLHAKLRHPRLTPQQSEADPTRPKEIGSAAHKLILGRGTDLVVIDAADYKKEATRSSRAAAYAAGKCPILKPDLEVASQLDVAVNRRLRESGDLEAFTHAPSEVVCIARDPSGVWLRAMFDKLVIADGRAVIWDVKTGDLSAEPNGLGRRISNMGMEVQAAFYRHVLALARPDLAGRIEFVWLFVENEPPHESTIADVDGNGRETGERKVAHAIQMWRHCVSSGIWPGYPRKRVTAQYPPYAAADWLDREVAHADSGGPLIDYRMAG